MVKQQVAEQINENKTSFVQDNTVINERIAVEASSNQNSVTQNVLQTESVEYSLETRQSSFSKRRPNVCKESVLGCRACRRKWGTRQEFL